jgi:hypothetical protein
MNKILNYVGLYCLVTPLCFLLVGCPGSKEESTGDVQETSTETEPKAEAPEKDAQKEFVTEMRTFGRTTQENISQCKKFVDAQLDSQKAMRKMPAAMAADVQKNCGALGRMYKRSKRTKLGKHYTVDNLVRKLAFAQDSTSELSAALTANKPGERLSSAIVRMRDDLRNVKKTADSIAGLRVDAKRKDVIVSTKVTIGRMISELKGKVKEEDRADLGALLKYFDALAYNAVKERRAVRKAELGAHALIFTSRTEGWRKRLRGMHSGDSAKDKKIYDAADAYFDACIALIGVYKEVSSPYLDAIPPSGKAADEGRMRLEVALNHWLSLNEAFHTGITEIL